jgi:hypothetical protein
MPYVAPEEDTLFSLRVRIKQLEAELDTYDLAVKTAARRIAELVNERDAIAAVTIERLAVAMMTFPNSSPHENSRMAAFIRSQMDTTGEQRNG